MPRRFYGCLILLCSVLPAIQQASAEPTTRPNVLFIISDDLNNHLACYGDPIVKTPNIDRLAQRGVRFDRAYCQYPVCNPSRTSFLSGLHPETTGIRSQTQMLHRDSMPDAIYLPDHFRANGYFTAGIGKVEHGGHYEIKWDVIDDFKGKGDGEIGGNTGESPVPRNTRRAQRRAAATAPNSDAEVTRRMKGDGLPYTVERQTEENDPENVDDLIAKKVVALLEKRKSGDKPFFIVAGFHKPHVPHVAPKRFFDMYPLDQMKLADVPKDDAKDIPPAAFASKKNYQPDMPEQTRRQIIRAYLASTSYMDEKVGQVTTAMDRLNLWDNTVVIFLGDHGWHFGEHNLWAKASLFEESARAPLILTAPGAKPNAPCPRVVEFLDLYPTLTEMCHLPPPPQSEGRSFASLLKNPEQPWDKVAYTCLGAGPAARSVRNERYRYTEWDDGRKGVELYDHETDPNELTNLARDPAHQPTILAMKRLLQKFPPTTPTSPKSAAN